MDFTRSNRFARRVGRVSAKRYEISLRNSQQLYITTKNRVRASINRATGRDERDGITR